MSDEAAGKILAIVGDELGAILRDEGDPRRLRDRIRSVVADYISEAAQSVVIRTFENSE